MAAFAAAGLITLAILFDGQTGRSGDIQVRACLEPVYAGMFGTAPHALARCLENRPKLFGARDAQWLRYVKHLEESCPVTTGMQGVDTERLSALVVAIGAGLAGLSGTIAGPLLALSPSMGAFVIIDCFVVVVTGGLSSFTGAFIAALLIGQVHNLGIVFIPEFASMLPLVIMTLVLLLRPHGLAGAGR